VFYVIVPAQNPAIACPNAGKGAELQRFAGRKSSPQECVKLHLPFNKSIFLFDCSKKTFVSLPKFLTPMLVLIFG